jgi:hypothetical protein
VQLGDIFFITSPGKSWHDLSAIQLKRTNRRKRVIYWDRARYLAKVAWMKSNLALNKQCLEKYELTVDTKGSALTGAQILEVEDPKVIIIYSCFCFLLYTF